jgi:cell division protein FtsI/penicillin-binding protein 2
VLRLRSRRLDCSHPPIALLSLAEALAYSCNSFFADVARRATGIELAGAFRRMGFDAGTPADAEQTALMSIGEWGVTANLTEIAHAYHALSGKCSSPAVAPILDGLQLATTVGTARLAAPTGVSVAGKTGTSPGRGGSGRNALFAGWAPARQPRIVVAVRAIGGSGGAEAAPVARTLFEKYL